MFLLTAVAASAMLYSGCAKPEISDGNQVGNLVTVYFGTENVDPSTKATLTPNEGETAFQAAWENEDAIKIEYSNDSKSETVTRTGTTTAIWNGKSFESKMPEYTGMWIYDAAYPVPSESDNSVDFGSNRTQKGNAYNSKYDIMIGTATAENAAAGKDALGKDIVFQMTRQTAIAYFHFTSELDEVVTSATLKVTDGAIANSSASINEQFKFVAPQENDLTEINLTFEEGTAPSAKDFQLWFNVLPTSYIKMTLTVETATKTFEITKATPGSYVAGKLYKVSKAIAAEKWTDNGGSVTPSKKVSVINYANVNSVKALNNGTYTSYESEQTLTVDGLEYNMKNICANTKNGSAGYMLGPKQFIQMQKNTSYICNTSAKVTTIKAYVLKATTSAIAVYEGTNSSSVETVITNPTPTEQTFPLINNNEGKTETTLDVYEYHINGGFFKLAPTGTLWLYRLEVTYSEEPTYSINFAEVTGGTLSANTISAEAAEEVTLTATPEVGYKFNEDWVVKDADDASIDVTDNKFTMPASNVTVSGSFSKIDYTISKITASERGSFVAKKGETTVETAQIGDEITLVATPNEGYELKSWTVVDSEDNAITVTDNKFTMPASNVTVTATFNSTASYTVSFSVNGTVTTKSYKETETIEFPTDPEISGVKFMGWTTKTISGVQATAPTFVETSSAVMGTEDLTYYAVFATQVGDVNTPAQTLAYDTWTYSGSTTNQSNYRLFHSGSYIESAEFDLSTLTKVVVYGGTFGGTQYNKLTIGVGTNTWKSVTVSGKDEEGKNTYTDGTPLKGTGKLRITSNSGSASSSGVRISKVEIYAVGYSDYCTNVVTLSSVAVSGTPTKTEYTVGDTFDPAGLTVTGTYSNGESAQISDGISWTFTPSIFDASGNQIVSVTATVKPIKSAAYVVNVKVNAITTTLTATDGSVKVGETLNVSTLFASDSDGAITYSLVGNPSGATINGTTFSASAADTYMVKASQAETDKYSAAEATATITVSNATTLTLSKFSFTQAETVSIDTKDKNVSIKAYKGNAGTSPGNYNGNIRLYQGSSSKYGGYITISVNKGVKLKSVEIESSSSYATTVASKVDSNAESDHVSLAKSSSYKVPGINETGADSVSIYCYGTTSSARLEIAKITVKYE